MSARRIVFTTVLLGSAAAASLGWAQTPPAAPASPPAATQAAPPAAPRPLPTVNGVRVTEQDVAAAEAELAEALQNVPEAQRREQLIDYIVTVRVLANQARTERLQDTDEAKARIAFAVDRYLMETFLRREIDKLVTTEAVEAFYRERVANQPPETEVRARHILVASEDAAKSLIEELKKGADFAQLATQNSTDPGSKDNGGDLGFFTRDRMVGEFATAAFSLQPGQFTQTPVRTQFGFHVIKVEESRQVPVPPLAELDAQIRNFLSRRAQGEIIGRLRQAAQITR